MNKQDFRSYQSYPGGGYSTSAPEISIFLAQASLDLEIDEDTGLPKLPVEPPAPSSPEVARSHKGHPKLQLASALKMSNDPPSSTRKVTFDPESMVRLSSLVAWQYWCVCQLSVSV